MNITQPEKLLIRFMYKLVMCSVSTNGEQASLANSKMTVDSLLECS